MNNTEFFTPELALWIFLAFFSILSLIAFIQLRKQEAPRYARKRAEYNEARSRAMAAHPAGKGRTRPGTVVTQGYDWTQE